MRSSSDVVGAWRDGWRRTLTAPLVTFGVFAATLTAAAPLAFAVRGEIEAHLGRSLAADTVADAVNFHWWQEFASQASGLGTTVTPSIVGFAATLANLSSILDARPQHALVASAIAVYLAAWTFLSGGIIDRYARQRPTRAPGFFAASGVFFWRFLRLAAIVGAAYLLLFANLHAWLFGEVYARLTRDLAVEREAFVWRAILYGVFGIVLLAVNLVADYARIRMVVEDRRSALGALRAAAGFIARHPGRVVGVYALSGAAFVLLIAVWALTAPGAGGSGASIWLGFAAAQLYVLARLMLKLQTVAAQTALFQGLLAHAAYTAAPVPVWPDSPAAETIR